MANGNGQGPQNAGPRTGRGRGFCSGSGMPGWMNNGSVQGEATSQQQPGFFSRLGRGLGNGAGRGANGGRGGFGNGRRRG